MPVEGQTQSGSEPRRYLVPREIVARMELAPGVGGLEAGIILAGALVGLLAQWVLALVGHLVPPTAHSVHDALFLARFLIFLGPTGFAYVSTRPTPGGSIADYLRAMRRWSGGRKTFLYGGDD